jgi:hypothetical protein
VKQSITFLARLADPEKQAEASAMISGVVGSVPRWYDEEDSFIVTTSDPSHIEVIGASSLIKCIGPNT